MIKNLNIVRQLDQYGEIFLYKVHKTPIRNIANGLQI